MTLIRDPISAEAPTTGALVGREFSGPAPAYEMIVVMVVIGTQMVFFLSLSSAELSISAGVASLHEALGVGCCSQRAPLNEGATLKQRMKGRREGRSEERNRAGENQRREKPGRERVRCSRGLLHADLLIDAVINALHSTLDSIAPL